MPSLIDIVNGPWAILPDRLVEIQGIYATHLRGEKINIEALEAKLGRKLDNRYEGFQVQDGVAVIPVIGAIAKRANMFTRVSGGVSTQLVQRDIEQALNDPKIKGIILNIDSGGGTVDGAFELADYIYQSRGQKPIVSFTDGMVCSAAYAVGSSADSLYISGDTNTVGSIGVVAAHRDYSRWENAVGVKTTEITAGKYKRISSQYEPLSDAGRADIQDKVDYLYGVFVDAVARNRGVSVDTVLSDMADGRVFVGKQSISNGLVDGVSTLDDLIDGIASGAITAGKSPAKTKHKAEAGVVTAATISTEETVMPMTKEKLQAEQPELHQALIDEGKALAGAEQKEAIDKAVAAEQERILALAGACLGEEAAAKLGTIVSAGLTSEQVSALGIKVEGNAGAADAESRQQILTAIKDGGQQPVGKVTEVEGKQEKDFIALVKEHHAAHDCSRTESMKAIAAAHPEAHAAYLKKQNEQ